MATVCLLLSLYVVPDLEQIAAPTDVERSQIEAALQTLATGAREESDVAVRQLALIGEAALPALVKRLQTARPGERLLLLSAARRMPRGAVLVEQARRDAHPAVRAWATPTPPRSPRPLRELANRYLDRLAVVETDLRTKADEDQKLASRPLGRPLESFQPLRQRMDDRRYASAMRWRRDRAAREFAIAGEAALRAGTLLPRLDDPVFVAYLGLLREKGEAFFRAIQALVAVGPSLAPVCEELLKRDNHDERKILRLLYTVRSDGGLAIYDKFDQYRPEVQRLMLRLAPRFLPRDDVVPFLNRAALASDESVRNRALDALLQRPAPVGLDVARKLFSPDYAASDTMRAARLLARAGETAPLLPYLDVAPAASDQTVEANRVRSLRRAATAALRKHGNADLGAKLLKADEKSLRILGIDLTRDPAKLLEYARHEPDAFLAGDAAVRSVKYRNGEGYEEVLAFLEARELRLSNLVRVLKHSGRIDALLKLTDHADERTRDRAVGALADLDVIDAKHEAAVLALHTKRPAALATLVALGTPAAGERFLAEEDRSEVIGVVRARAEQGLRIPFPLPMLEWIRDADADRLLSLTRIAESLPNPEPGLYRALVDAWSALPDGKQEGTGLDAGAAQQKIRLLDALAYSNDAQSANELFSELLAGRLRTPSLLLGVFKSAARHVPDGDLGKLLPHLRKWARAEHPLEDKVAPPFDATRTDWLHGGLHALAYRKVVAALPLLTDLILDPQLYSPAFDRRDESWLPWRALDSLRFYPRAPVAKAFRAALQRARDDGRLARMDPERLFALLVHCRQGRRYGRSLPEIGLLLAQVLERLPFDGRVPYHKMVSYSGLRRYTEAAQTARASAEKMAAEGYTSFDGYWTPERLRRRAKLFDAIVSKDSKQLATTVDALGDDAMLLYLASFHLCFGRQDYALAEEAALRAVHATAGLYRPYRDMVAAVRIARGDAGEAIFWLDPNDRLPVERTGSSKRHYFYLAQAFVMLGDETKAGYELENGLAGDRRFLPEARVDPKLKGLAPVLQHAENDFFDWLFK